MRRQHLVHVGLLRIGRDGKLYPATWSRKDDPAEFRTRVVIAEAKLRTMDQPDCRERGEE
jgi:hypothetical protein